MENNTIALIALIVLFFIAIIVFYLYHRCSYPMALVPIRKKYSHTSKKLLVYINKKYRERLVATRNEFGITYSKQVADIINSYYNKRRDLPF